VKQAAIAKPRAFIGTVFVLGEGTARLEFGSGASDQF
jgi:hypothetical protein